MSFEWTRSGMWVCLPPLGGGPAGPKRRSCYPCGYEAAFLGPALASRLEILLQSHHIEEADASYALSNHCHLLILVFWWFAETRIVMHHPCPFPFRAALGNGWGESVEVFVSRRRLFQITVVEELLVQVELLRGECWSRIARGEVFEVGSLLTWLSRLPYRFIPI